MRRRRSLSHGFSPRQLFNSGAKGAWYDPSDYSTLFQDSAGATPVTAVEQSVRLMRDKSGNGNHATAPSDASRPVLRARYNLLTKTEQFVESGKYKPTNITVTENAGTAPDGTSTAIKLAATATATTTMFYESALGQTAYRHIWYVKKGVVSGNFANVLLFRNSTTSTNVALSNINFSTGVISNVIGTAFSSEDAGNGWWKITATVTSGFAATDTVRLDYGWSSAAATAGDFILVWHPDCRNPNLFTSAVPAYQRVNTATDYDTTGFLPYLKFDGTDDSFGTNSINFSATDKMSVCAGVTKLSDAAFAVAAELSAVATSNNGAFLLAAPNAAGPQVAFYSRGTTTANASVNNATYAAPYVSVVSGLSDISADSVVLRLNGSQVATDATDQGTGNYGTYPLYIGRRNNTSSPFNGNIYQLIICGKTLSASELASTEAYVNSKTGAY